MTATDASLKAALKGPRFALIGAGQLGEMSLAMWPDVVSKPEFFVDTMKTGTLAGLPVYDLKTHVPVENVVYLLSAFKLPTRDVKAIFEKLGQSQILTVYDFFEETTPDWFSNGWRNLSPDAGTQRKLITLADYYCDDLSTKAVLAALAWRYYRDLVDDYPVGPESAKYDLSLFGRGGFAYDNVFDCGSFDLGLEHYLTDAGVTFDRYMAIDADPKCFAACANAKSKMPADVQGRIDLVQAAVSVRADEQRFMASGLLAARLLNDDAPSRPDILSVTTTTLDALATKLPDQGHGARNLIKLHIEGAELPALKGARSLIENSRTDILANLSHNEEQFLEIPRFLSEFGVYDIFLRSHSLFGEGLTLFAKNRH